MIAGPPPLVPHVPTISEITKLIAVLQTEREWHWKNTPWMVAKERCDQLDNQIRKLISQLVP